LTEALQKDSNSSVRHEAVIAIGKIRPVAQQTVLAVEYAAQKDAAVRVRVAAERTLASWKISGARAPKAPENNPKAPEKKNSQTDEPPVAPPQPTINNSGSQSLTPRAPIVPVDKNTEPRPLPALISAPTNSKPFLPRDPVSTKDAKSTDTKEPMPMADGPALNPPK
jgi:hypothetical protein